MSNLRTIETADGPLHLDTTPAIYAAMVGVMGDVGHVAKTKNNTQQGYKFRGIDDIYAALQGPLVKHGVFCVPTVLEQTVRERESHKGGTLIYTTLKVSHRFYAKDGSSVEAVTVGEAMDSGDKSSNKAMSAALKYAFLEVFCIPTEGDNDSENQTHEVAHKAAPVPVKTPVAPRPSVTTPASRPSETPTAPTRTGQERYNDVCEELDRRLGIKAATVIIDRIKAKHGGSTGTKDQKLACLDELEALVRGDGVPVSDENGDDITAMDGEGP